MPRGATPGRNLGEEVATGYAAPGGERRLVVTRRGVAIQTGRVLGESTWELDRDEDEVRRALARLGETVGQVLEETGRSEEELAQMFDVRRRHAE